MISNYYCGGWFYLDGRTIYYYSYDWDGVKSVSEVDYLMRNQYFYVSDSYVYKIYHDFDPDIYKYETKVDRDRIWFYDTEVSASGDLSIPLVRTNVSPLAPIDSAPLGNPIVQLQVDSGRVEWELEYYDVVQGYCCGFVPVKARSPFDEDAETYYKFIVIVFTVVVFFIMMYELLKQVARLNQVLS